MMENRREASKGFSIILIIAIGAIVATFGWIAYATWQQSVDDSNFTLTLPFVKHKAKNANTNSTVNSNTSAQKGSSSTAEWKMYTVNADGISFKFPPTWTVSSENGATADSNRYIGLRPGDIQNEDYWSIITEDASVMNREKFIALNTGTNIQSSVSDIDLAGKPATRIVLTQTGNPSYFKVIIAVFGSSKHYIIGNEGAVNPDFDTFLSTFAFTQ